MSELINAFVELLIIGFLIIIFVYVLLGILLNKFNKLIYGKGTFMAWLPVFNFYLLGKLTFNKVVGWILVIITLISGSYSYTKNGVTKNFSILPQDIVAILDKIMGPVLLVLIIYAIVKYNKFKKATKNINTTNNNSIQPNDKIVDYNRVVDNVQKNNIDNN